MFLGLRLIRAVPLTDGDESATIATRHTSLP